ncbi:response regulator [Acuticoccus mangrovi]|uniref:Response regulator n=1 Tax=Acuticoccus mangrovi TaxID=2796142 RepID=A0A934IPH1_9HYPH|nr:response regulator [Acuticoccus mangrovi]
MTPLQSRILFVDDDMALAQATAEFLRERGFAVAHAATAAQARQMVANETFDVFLLDIVMPGVSGKVLCREIAATQRAGIIMVSSLESDAERIALLEMGADDYIVKPFNPLELLARIRAFLRRRAGDGPPARATRLGPWSIGEGGRLLKHEDGRVVTLTPSEAQVLRHFLANPGLVCSREEILAISRLRQHAGLNDRSVDNLMKRLRRKIEPDPAHPTYLQTVWGRGYVFVEG